MTDGLLPCGHRQWRVATTARRGEYRPTCAACGRHYEHYCRDPGAPDAVAFADCRCCGDHLYTAVTARGQWRENPDRYAGWRAEYLATGLPYALDRMRDYVTLTTPGAGNPYAPPARRLLGVLVFALAPLVLVLAGIPAMVHVLAGGSAAALTAGAATAFCVGVAWWGGAAGRACRPPRPVGTDRSTPRR